MKNFTLISVMTAAIMYAAAVDTHAEPPGAVPGMRGEKGNSHFADDLLLGVSFAVDGKILEIYACKGQMVRKGDLLARIDPNNFFTNLQVCETDFMNARSAALDAAENYVLGNGDMDEMGSALYQLLVVSNDYMDRRYKMDNTVLRAPVDGVVFDIKYRDGENCEKGEYVMMIWLVDLWGRSYNIEPINVSPVISGGGTVYRPSGSKLQQLMEILGREGYFFETDDRWSSGDYSRTIRVWKIQARTAPDTNHDFPVFVLKYFPIEDTFVLLEAEHSGF